MDNKGYKVETVEKYRAVIKKFYKISNMSKKYIYSKITKIEKKGMFFRRIKRNIDQMKR